MKNIRVFVGSALYGQKGYIFALQEQDYYMHIMDFSYSIRSLAFTLRMLGMDYDEFYLADRKYIRLSTHHSISKMVNGYWKKYGEDAFFSLKQSGLVEISKFLAKYMYSRGCVNSNNSSLADYHHLEYYTCDDSEWSTYRKFMKNTTNEQ